MILAGIDEAGYGPLLGPLVVGCCAFEVDDADPNAEFPCLWTRLRKVTSRSRVKNGKKLHINDSKLVYGGAGGLKELERSILTLSAATYGWSPDLVSLLGHVANHVVPELEEYPWYAPAAEETFPLEQEGLSLQLFSKALVQEMGRNGAKCLHLGARVVLEKQLNRLLDAMRNKGSMLFSITAIHLDYLLRTYGHQPLAIVCDRQGGRGHYGSLLRLMFEEWSLEITAETEGFSEYALLQPGKRVRIIFTEKAEAQCLPVAAASMLSKYLREAMMRRFNAWWRTHLPDLAPTAGYYTDGSRFLLDIAAKRRELNIPDDHLIRSR